MLPSLFSDQLPTTHAFLLQSYLASLLPVMLMIDKIFLYPTALDHLVDHVCETACREGYDERGLGVSGVNLATRSTNFAFFNQPYIDLQSTFTQPSRQMHI